ncbi:unnamed protein product [Rhizophagus irregularis]|nr:unnamed protein product [Rhizophagus irregularis]
MFKGLHIKRFLINLYIRRIFKNPTTKKIQNSNIKLAEQAKYTYLLNQKQQFLLDHYNIASLLLITCHLTSEFGSFRPLFLLFENITLLRIKIRLFKNSERFQSLEDVEEAEGIEDLELNFDRS